MGSDVHVFVSYARSDMERVTGLVQDLEWLADGVWFDSHVSGGQRWWNTILDQIQACTLFALVVTPASVRSPWCLIEAEWARDLQRPILPVRLDTTMNLNLVPSWIREYQVVDLAERTVDGLLPVVRAVRLLTRDPLPLTSVLPPRPVKPAGPLDDEQEKLNRNELPPFEQRKLLAVFQAALTDPAHRHEATELLQILLNRDDVIKPVHDQGTAALASLASAFEPPAPQQVSLTEGRTVRGFEGHTAWVWGCAVAPDGTYIVSTSDKILRLWSPTTGDSIRTPLKGHTGRVWGCAVAPDGTYIVSASADRTLRLWDPTTGDTINTLTGHTGPVFGCAVAPDGTYIVSTSKDRTLHLWQ